MGFVFIVEVSKRSEHGVGRSFPEAAQTAGAYLPGEMFQLHEVLRSAFARADPVQYVQHAPRADATKGAFSTRLILGELQEKSRHVDHASAVVEHDQTTGTHNCADFAKGF